LITTLNEVVKQFDYNLETMKLICESLQREMVNGLTGKPSSLAMIPSYVTKLPTGNET